MNSLKVDKKKLSFARSAKKSHCFQLMTTETGTVGKCSKVKFLSAGNKCNFKRFKWQISKTLFLCTLPRLCPILGFNIIPPYCTVGQCHKVTIYRVAKPSRLFWVGVLFSDFYRGWVGAQTHAREEGWEYFIFV